MDLNLIAAAHRIPANQIHFDLDAFDRAVLRAEKRRLLARAFWMRLEARASAIANHGRLIINLAPAKRA